MLDFTDDATAQSQQLLMFLEETGLPYRRVPATGALALVDHWPVDGGAPLALHEAGAMLLYLAEKANFGLPAGLRGRQAARQWLFWQKGFACRSQPTAALFATLDRQLTAQAYLCGEQYSVADIACFPWVSARGAALAAYPHLARWFHAVSQRAATRRAYGSESAAAMADSADADSALAEVLP